MDLKGLSLGRGALERRPHLIKWAIISLGKRKGGLGVRCLSTLNRALLDKWSWSFSIERKQVISRKFRVEK